MGMVLPQLRRVARPGCAVVPGEKETMSRMSSYHVGRSVRLRWMGGTWVAATVTRNTGQTVSVSTLVSEGTRTCTSLFWRGISALRGNQMEWPTEWTEEEVSAWVEELKAAGFDVESYRWSGVNSCVSISAYPEYIPEWVSEGAETNQDRCWTRCYWPGAALPA